MIPIDAAFDPGVMAKATFEKSAAVGLRHAEENRAYVKKTVADLKGWHSNPGSAIVIAAGPSLHRAKSIQRIQEAGFKGAVVACDGTLSHCLRNGVVPDFVLCVDPNTDRVIRWFGDPDLARRAPDDYFQRQDLDPCFAGEEAERNREVLSLIERYAPRVRAVLSTSVSPEVARRVLDTGMEVYWWNPIYDDFDAAGSVTRKVFDLTGAPCMATGGNVGTCAWVFAISALGRNPVAVVGLDFSYAPDTPLSATQYYSELREVFGNRFEQAYKYLKNPHSGETWFTDPAYWWYRESFLELVRWAPSPVYNCTEGGIVFGPGIIWCPVEDFVEKTRRKATQGGGSRG